jgi:hypothetical protein
MKLGLSKECGGNMIDRTPGYQAEGGEAISSRLKKA